jgi:hypothetical protein
MFDIITKSKYFRWIDQGFGTSPNTSIKKVQDAFILSVLFGKKGKRIAEIGGGQSRVLDVLSHHNECWNIDPLEGIGNGPHEYKTKSDIKLIKAHAGEFCTDEPSDYFDYVFSISVVEHIKSESLDNFFRDTTRMLKQNGLSIHAIDVYLGDHVNLRVNPRIDQYLEITSQKDIGLTLIDPPSNVNSHTTFRCHYASNSDDSIYGWNKLAPGPFCEIRNSCQCVSLKAIWKRVACPHY